MNGVDDIHTDPDRAGAMAAPPDGADMTHGKFAAAAAAHDARAMAAAVPGIVVVHTGLEDFVRTVEVRQLEKPRRDADARTADQMRVAHVWTVDEVALYLRGARAFLQAFAEDMPDRPMPSQGTTGYAMVIPPGSVACLTDPAGTTTTVALGPDFQDDPVGRDELYDGLRVVFTADRESRVPPAAKAFPPANTDQALDASTAPASAPADRPTHRRGGR